MPSERIQRRIDAFLDEADAASTAGDWPAVAEKAAAVLGIDPGNEDAKAFLERARSAAAQASGSGKRPIHSPAPPETHVPPGTVGRDRPPLATSFAGGRYRGIRLLGEGAKKRVYLAHDTRLDRDVAFALVRTEGLDSLGRQRVQREAQAMGRLGSEPHLVSIYDVGEENGQPFIVMEHMAGGDLGSLLERGPLPLERSLRIAEEVCRGLEFIHSRGFVHRDLKPGNVFLTAEGAAKVADLGLAVALDRSRLTQPGSMVGTASYMPPEQALGGEVTPRSDLYSLGAMLYELVTGHPPFAGSDPTAVISQHINTQPVAPSWLTEHCPPPLEELILRLLAKDPTARPASAAEVRQALETVDPAQKSASHSDSSALERLARGVFVGREAELAKLQKAFDEAFAGRGSLVMLVGEPGIGKTRTAQELETHARMRGAQVLWGRAHEQAGAPPYWPWVQVGRLFGSTTDLALLRPEMGSAESELSRLFPELRAQPGFVEPEPITDPQGAQFRLFDAYATFLRAVAARAPAVIALDDLHWADKPTLLLLQHVARDLSRLRVLVVGTYRDTELSRTHPLSEALAGLNRDPGFLRLPLRGLSRDEVAAYIRAVARTEPSRGVLERIYEETEGNPFFLSEVVNLMTQEGTLTRESVSDIAIPEGVKEALGRRLDRVGEEANELLQVAAIVGREFTFETLSLLGERDEDELLRLIEEAIDARVIEELQQPGRYRFTHALMQETLLAELSTTRRVRLHGQVGEALERRWGDRADERASRLALHFVEAATLSPRYAEKAVRYSKLAAEQAETQAAWDEAARHYEHALSLVTTSEARLGEDEPALLVALGRCCRNSGQYRAAWRSLMRACSLYRDVDDGEGFARATLEAVVIFAPPGRQAALVGEALDLLADTNPHLAAQLLRQRLQFLRPGTPESNSAAQRARELVRRHGLVDVAAQLSEWEGDVAAAELRFAEAEACYRSAFDQYQALRNRAAAAGSYVNVVSWGFAHRPTADAERVAHEALRHCREAHIEIAEQNTLNRLTGLALARADRARFESLAASCPGDNFSISLQRLCWDEWSGALDAAVAALPVQERAGTHPGFLADLYGNRARVLHNAGLREAAAQELGHALGALDEVRRHLPLQVNDWLYCLVLGADEALPALADSRIVAELYGQTRAWPPGFWIPLSPRSPRRIRGQLALSLGLLGEARTHFEGSLEWSIKEEFPVEAGRSLQGLGEVAARRGNRTSALGHLNRAAEYLSRAGAKFYLDQVIARKLELQGITADDVRSSLVAVNTAVQAEKPDLSLHAAPDGAVTLMFTDIENSTALTEQLGDARWLEVLRAHNALVEKHTNAHGGRIVKNRGDGYMLTFARPDRGLACAFAIQRALAGHEVIRVRLGLHTGNPQREGEDFFGTDVNLAARIADRALGGQVLVSERTQSLLARGDDGDTRFEEPIEVELKGFSGTHRVFEARWT